MTESISNISLSRLSELISSHMGLHFPTDRWPDIQRGIRSAAPEFGFNDAGSCIQWLLSEPLTRNQIEILASHITVGETYFFREKPLFDTLREHILPELIHPRRENGRLLRIWSAGCATGEEPYSIAILLSKMIPDINDWNVTILATDINPRFLEKASLGLYKEWSFRNTPPDLKEEYFTKTKENCYKILPQIKRMVQFAYLNLAEDTYPSLLNDTNAMDLIFCKNVLMYFAPEQQKKVIRKLYQVLVDDGWLAVSPSETSQLLFSQFASVNFPQAILYRKDLYKKDRRPVLPAQDFEPAFTILEHPLELDLEVEPPLPWPVQSDPDQHPVARPERQEPEPQLIPEPRPTLFEEARALYGQGNYTAAADKLIKSAPDDYQAFALLARVYANMGQLTEAFEWCEKAVSADKLNPGAHYLRATILQELGQVNEASASLKRALYLDPDFILAHFALGNIASRQGKLKESERHFRNALALLESYGQAEVLPEADGVTVGRLSEIISLMIERHACV
ncbi:MAG TPA: CheR family methyltransferase [archaeon]|nr:CheR family methyltransferase [archaeon]